MSLDQGPVVKTETGPPTDEHLKTGHAGQIAFGVALMFIVVSALAAMSEATAIALTAAGLCLAMCVVGLMLHFESERQQQRPDTARPRRRR